MQPTFGFGVVFVDEGKYLGTTALRLYALAGDDFEPTLGSGFLIRGVDVATVQPDGEWWPWRRQLLPVIGATFDELKLLLAQFFFETLGHTVQLAPHRRVVDFVFQRQHLGQ